MTDPVEDIGEKRDAKYARLNEIPYPLIDVASVNSRPYSTCDDKFGRKQIITEF